jgi:hypothetical protein
MTMSLETYVDRLSSDPQERAILQAVARGLEGNPFASGGRGEAFLHQLIQPAERPDGTPLTPEESLEFMTSFGDAIGVPVDVVTPALYQIADVDLGDISTEAIEDQGLVDHLNDALRNDPAGLVKNPHAEKEYQTALTRLNNPRPEKSHWTNHDDARVAEIEAKYMRAEPGTHDWKQYWRGPLQAEYAGLLERKMAPQPMPTPEPVEPDVETE